MDITAAAGATTNHRGHLLSTLAVGDAAITSNLQPTPETLWIPDLGYTLRVATDQDFYKAKWCTCKGRYSRTCPNGRCVGSHLSKAN